MDYIEDTIYLLSIKLFSSSKFSLNPCLHIASAVNNLWKYQQIFFLHKSSAYCSRFNYMQWNDTNLEHQSIIYEQIGRSIRYILIKLLNSWQSLLIMASFFFPFLFFLTTSWPTQIKHPSSLHCSFFLFFHYNIQMPIYK